MLDDEPSWPDQEGPSPTISNKVEEDTDDDLPALVEASDSGKWSTDLETCVFHHSSPCLCHQRTIRFLTELVFQNPKSRQQVRKDLPHGKVSLEPIPWQKTILIVFNSQTSPS